MAVVPALRVAVPDAFDRAAPVGARLGGYTKMRNVQLLI